MKIHGLLLLLIKKIFINKKLALPLSVALSLATQEDNERTMVFLNTVTWDTSSHGYRSKTATHAEFFFLQDLRDRIAADRRRGLAEAR